MISRMLDAINHPTLLVRSAARAAVLAPRDGAAIDNLVAWLDRCEPGWKHKRSVAWSDH
jgi:hypothetical protein